MIWHVALYGVLVFVVGAVGVWAGVKLAAAKQREEDLLRRWAEHIANPDDECCWQAAYPECYPETVAELGAIGRDMAAAKQDMAAANSEGGA